LSQPFFLPEYGTYTKSGTVYNITIDLEDLFAYDHDYATDVLMLYEPADELYEVKMMITYNLGDQFQYRYETETYQATLVNSSVTYNILSNLTVTHPTSIEHQTFNREDYVYSLFDIPDFCDYTYIEGEDEVAVMRADSDNFAMFELEAGFYKSDYMENIYDNITIEVFDSAMNPIPYTGLYEIPMDGIYYINYHNSGSSDQVWSVSFDKYPDQYLGTPENPIIQPNHITGTITSEDVKYLLLMKDANPGYVVIEVADTSNRFNTIIGLASQEMYEGDVLAFLVYEDTDLILGIQQYNMYNTDYDFTWIYYPFTQVDTNLKTMPILEFNQVKIMTLGEPDYEQRYRIDVVTEGEYYIQFFEMVESGENIIYLQMEIYNSNDELVAELNGSDNVVLEPGSYYLKAYSPDGSMYVIYVEMQLIQ